MASTSKRSWKLQDFMAHGANVNCLSLGHKSGRVLVTGGDDKKVNLWAVGKEGCIMSLNGHTTPVECVRFDPMEEVVVAGSSAGALKIWDLEAVKILRTFTGHKAGVRSVDFHPYGNNLVSGSLDTTIKLWDTRYKGHMCTYNVHRQTVNSVKFSPDGQWVASGDEEGLVKILDLRTRKVVSEFASHSSSVTSVEYHPHEFLLASASTDRTVKFWELENFTLVSTSDRDSTPLRCITFSPNGQCLYAGAQDLLRVYMWEPARTLDSIPMSWGKIQDIAIANTQLIGATFRLTNVALWVVDLSKLAPLGGPSLETMNPFSHGQSTRKSFSKQSSPNTTKSNPINTKTIEEVDLTETDPEDETVADILNVSDYRSIFQPNKSLTRSPPPTFPPPLSDEDLSLTNLNQIPGSPTEAEDIETPAVEPPTVILDASSSSPPHSPLASDSDSPRHRMGSPILTPPHPAREQVRRYSSCKEPDWSPSDSEFSVKLSNIQHSRSEQALPRYSHSRKNSIGRQFDLRSSPNLNSTTKTELLNSVNSSKLSSDVTIYVAKEKPNTVSREEKETEFVPMSNDKPSGIDIGDFLPQRLLNHNFPPIMSESEVTNSVLSHHQNMLTVLRLRDRNLQIVYSLWQNKDLKAAMDYAIGTTDSALLVDLLDVFTQRPSLWNLDICALVLPSIFELLQSKYEKHMTVGCNALRLILRTFSPVIKTNIVRSSASLGVDISREERYNKCVKCYNSLVPIRAFVLKRQTMQGKLGHSFRELHVLLQELGTN